MVDTRDITVLGNYKVKLVTNLVTIVTASDNTGDNVKSRRSRIHE